MSEKPFVSVITPTYNEVDTLRQCLPALFNQSYNNYEIILVDDGSQDDTRVYASQFLDNKIPFQLISQENAGAAAARNKGIQHAKGDIIAFIDTGCRADVHWLSDLIASIDEAAGVGGRIVLTADHNAIARYSIASRQYQHRTRSGKVEYLLSGNSAYRKEILDEIGGFRSFFGGEDVDLSYRIASAGYKLIVTDKAFVFLNDAADNLKSIQHKYFRRGYANYYYSRTWQELGYPRSPFRELTRHLGAAILSPILSIRYANRVNWRDYPWYVLITIVEHVWFSLGLIRAMTKRDRYADS